MRRVLTAVFLGIAAGIGMAFLAAVVLGILNLYLTGHNIRWQEQTLLSGPFAISYLDLILLACAALALLGTTYLSLKSTR